MDAVNEIQLPIRDERCTQVEELVKHQISRVEKILESSLARTASLIEQQMKRVREDEQKRQNIEIEMSRIIPNSVDISDDKSGKTKHDIGIKENTEKTSSFLGCAIKSSKTFKSIGINTDAKIKFQSQSTDDEQMPKTQDQQLVLSNSTADRKRQQFAGRKKIYKPKDTRPFCTISISVDQHLGRTSINHEEPKFEDTSDSKQIIVRAPSGSSEMDVLVSGDVVQENSVYLTTGSIESVETVFFNRSAVSNLSDVPQTVVSIEHGKHAERMAADRNVLKFQTNSQMKECALEADISKQKTVTTESILNSNIDHNLVNSQMQNLGTEYDSSEISSCTAGRIPSQSGEARIPQSSNCDASVSTDCYSNTRLKDNVRIKRHKRKIKKPVECGGSDSETSTSSTSNARLPIQVEKDSAFKCLRRPTEKRKSNVNFDQNKGEIVGVGSDNSQSARQSAPELRYSGKAESTKPSDRKCFSEGHDRSYPYVRCDPSIRLRPSDLQEWLISSEDNKTMAHRQQSVTDSGSDYKSQSSNNTGINKKSRASKHSSRSISSHSDNTSCGNTSRNVSKASVHYQKLEDENSLTECLPSLSSKLEQRVTHEQKDTIDNIACEGAVDKEKAIKYTLLADESTEKADEIYLNQNKVCSEIDDPNGEVDDNVTSEVFYESNEVEQENYLTINKDESEKIHDSQIENIDVSIDNIELPENDITVDNRGQSSRVSNVPDDKVSSTNHSLTAMLTDIKPESTTELRISDDDKSCERVNPSTLDDSSCTARSFEDKYHFVMETLEKQLKATTAPGDSHASKDFSCVEIGLGQEIKNRGRNHSMNISVSLDHSVSSCESLRNGPSSEPVRSKRKQRVQLESAFPCQVTAHENLSGEISVSGNHETIQFGEEISSTEENSKHGDVSICQSSFELDDSSDNLNLLSIRSNEKQCRQESTLNDSDIRVDDETSTTVIFKSEKNSDTKPLDITKDDSSVSIDYYSDIRTALSCIVDSSELSPVVQTLKSQKVSNLKNKVVRDVGKSNSPDELDSTDIESLDSSFYERSASRRDITTTAVLESTSNGDDGDISFAAETSVSTAPGTANGTERTDDVSDNCFSVPVSLDYYSDLVTPVTSLRYVLDEWSEPVENPFKLKRKTKRLNRKKTITDVHVTLGGKNSQHTSAIHRSSTPCRDSKGVSVITNANEGDLVGNESEMSASSIQYSPDLQHAQEQDCNEDNTLSLCNNERALDSFRSSTSSCGGRPKEPFESSLRGRVDDEATTTEDVASSIFPEDVNDATDVDEQLQLDETDFSEVTDILGTSTETFTTIENPNYKP